MDEQQTTEQQQAVNTFIAAAAVTLLGLALEFIWGAGWRWEASTALVGVAVALALPIAEMIRVQKPTGAIGPEMAEPVVGPRSPGSVSVPSFTPQSGPQWHDGALRPPDAYFEARHDDRDPDEGPGDAPAGPPVAPPPAFSPVAQRPQRVDVEPMVGMPETTLQWPRPGGGDRA